MRALRMLLMMDATVLVLLGAFFILLPRQILVAFQFADLPRGVNYLLGLWGCCFASLGLGYGIAATDPRRHVAPCAHCIRNRILPVRPGFSACRTASLICSSA